MAALQLCAINTEEYQITNHILKARPGMDSVAMCITNMPWVAERSDKYQKLFPDYADVEKYEKSTLCRLQIEEA